MRRSISISPLYVLEKDRTRMCLACMAKRLEEEEPNVLLRKTQKVKEVIVVKYLLHYKTVSESTDLKQ